MAILFYSKSPQYFWLSNFSPHGFTLEGLRWSSVEHYYQAHKYPHTATFEQIRNAPTPLKARKTARNRSLVIRSDWSEVKETVMLRGVYAKFEQNRQLRKRLVATGQEKLIHRSAKDLYWGQNDEGSGENRLGKLLMEVRQQLQ